MLGNTDYLMIPTPPFSLGVPQFISTLGVFWDGVATSVRVTLSELISILFEPNVGEHGHATRNGKVE